MESYTLLGGLKPNCEWDPSQTKERNNENTINLQSIEVHVEGSLIELNGIIY